MKRPTLFDRVFYKWRFFARYAIRLLWAMVTRRPFKLTLMVTGGCNYKCGMCDIWTQKRTYLSLSEMQEFVIRFPGPLSWVNISGGEPMLNPDLPAFIYWLAEERPGLLVTVTTNGSIDYSAALLAFIRIQKRLFFYNLVSVDGPEGIHDEVRGKKGAYVQAMKLIHQLEEIKQENPLVDVAISFTLMARNLSLATQFLYEMTARGLAINLNVVQNSPYYQKTENADVLSSPSGALQTEKVLHNFLQMIWKWSPERVIRSIYILLLMERIRGRSTRLPCSSITDNLLVHSDGSVRDCTLNYRPVHKTLSWAQRSRQLRKEVDQLGCEATCLTPCEKYLHIQHLIFRPLVLFQFLRQIRAERLS